METARPGPGDAACAAVEQAVARSVGWAISRAEGMGVLYVCSLETKVDGRRRPSGTSTHAAPMPTSLLQRCLCGGISSAVLVLNSDNQSINQSISQSIIPADRDCMPFINFSGVIAADGQSFSLEKIVASSAPSTRL